VNFSEGLAGFREGDALVDFFLRETRQLGAEGADGGPLWTHQNPVLDQALSLVEVDDREPDLDDLAHLARRRLPIPTGGLDIGDVDQAHTASLGTLTEKGEQFTSSGRRDGQRDRGPFAVPNSGEITTKLDTVAGRAGPG
jgi:hypothetical protein